MILQPQRALGAFCAAVLGLLTLTTPSTASGLTNGSFESGLTGWSSVGDASVVTSTFGRTPPNGSNQAFLTNDLTNGSVSTGSLETFLGIGNGSLTALSGVGGSVTNGSALMQSFTGTAGDTLKFKFDFLTSEDPTFPPFNQDFSFVSINGLTELANVSGTPITEPVPSGLGTPSIDDYLTESGYQTFTYVLPTTGTYSLGVGVVNVGTNDIISSLLVDDFTLTPGKTPPPGVPEPGTGATLAALGFTFAFFALLRKRKPQSV